MGRTLCMALLVVLVTASAWAEEQYMPKSGERVDWEKVFSGEGLLDQEEDYSEVLGRDGRKDRIDWSREMRAPAQEIDQPGAAVKKPAPEIRYKLDTPEDKAENRAVKPERLEIKESDIQEPSKPAPVESVAKPKPSVPADVPKTDKPKAPSAPRNTAAVEPRQESLPEPKPEPKRLFNDEEVEHFLTLAFYDKDEQAAFDKGGEAPRAKALTRWDQDVAVQVKGAVSEDESAQLFEVVQAVDAVVSEASGIRVRRAKGEEANVIVFFLPARKGEETSGYVKKTYQGARIVRCDVVMYSGRTSKRDMMRQFMRAMGFIGQSRQDGTVMNRHESTPIQGGLPKKDAKALRMLYRAGFAPGLDIETARGALTTAYIY